MSIQQDYPADSPATDLAQKPTSQIRQLARISFFLRLALALLLGTLYFGGLPPALLGQHHPELFAYVVVIYFSVLLVSGLLLKLHADTEENLAYFAVFIDIIAFTLLMHASGGLKSGLGMLIAISIANGCLTIHGRAALLFAALATLAILTEQIYAQLTYDQVTTAYTHAGVLGTAFFTIALLADVLSRRLAETEQLASQRQLDLANLAQLNEYIIQHMQTGVMVLDEGERIRLENEAARTLLGMTTYAVGQSLGQACPTLRHKLRDWKQQPDNQNLTFRASEGGRDLRASFIRLGREGLSGTLLFLEDSALVTERAQQMKLASLGRLTAKIAHEIRNPLSAISHAGQLLEESPQLSGGDLRLTEIIRNNAVRVNDIIENVLQLSRRTPSQFAELELGPWLQEFAAECCHTHGLGSEGITINISPKDTKIRIDPGQFRQILTNLVDNAVRHFAGGQNELRIDLRGGITADSGGPYLEISDNGPGIDEETQRHIFEPFFTTGNQGTGLGLYIARELCETNRARLEYRPTLEDGSCFRISFPGLRKKVFNP